MRETTFVVMLSLVLLSVEVLADVPNQNGYQGTLNNERSMAPDTTVSVAERYLEQAAQKSHRNKIIAGTSGLMIGAGMIIWGTTSSDEAGGDGEGSAGAILAGGLLGGVAALTMLIPCPAEKELEKVRTITDQEERDRVSKGALLSLAQKARKQRLIIGTIFGATSLLYLTLRPMKEMIVDIDVIVDHWGNVWRLPVPKEVDSAWNDYYGLAYGALAIYSFLHKTPEEMARKGYMLEQQNKLGIRFDINPAGHSKIALVRSF
ncbi:MAG: hypothetical protein AMJ92_00595 [candidate division Zixibacteria bacterium SM23_81]|nr:MAG: hypothetical protein AMJ92_00595 [candidate division Zixibacteria bacterium SM23_81]